MESAALPVFQYEELVSRLSLPPLAMASRDATRSATATPRVAPKQGARPDPYRVCGDGERTAHLVRLAGTWIGEGKDAERVEELCLGWNSRNDPPLPKEKVVATVQSVARTHMRNHPDDAPKELTPLFDLESARASRFSGPPPEKDWLLTLFLLLGKVAALVATGGVGKSMFTLQLAIAVAAGVRFLNWDVASPGSVLVLAAEDDEDELHRRLFEIAKVMALTPEQWQTLEQRLFVKSMSAEMNLMTNAVRGREVEPTDYVDRLLLVTQQIKDLKLIVVDPASRFRGGDENTSQDVTRFIEQLERLAKATGATVLVVHHTNKGALTSEEQSQGGARGSTAFSDGVRWQLNLRTPTMNEARKLGIPEDVRKRHLVAVNTKNNYGPLADEVVLMRGDGGVLAVGQIAGQGPSSYRRVYDFLVAEASDGRHYTTNSLENSAGGKVGKLGVGKVHLRRIVEQGVEKGYWTRTQRGRLIPTDRTPP